MKQERFINPPNPTRRTRSQLQSGSRGRHDTGANDGPHQLRSSRQHQANRLRLSRYNETNLGRLDGASWPPAYARRGKTPRVASEICTTPSSGPSICVARVRERARDDGSVTMPKMCIDRSMEMATSGCWTSSSA